MKLLIHACPALFALWGAFCLGNVCMAQSIAVPGSNDVIITEQLVEAIIQVESQGDPQRVGSMGERGLMQIRLATWREMTRGIYGRPQTSQVLETCEVWYTLRQCAQSPRRTRLSHASTGTHHAASRPLANHG